MSMTARQTQFIMTLSKYLQYRNTTDQLSKLTHLNKKCAAAAQNNSRIWLYVSDLIMVTEIIHFFCYEQHRQRKILGADIYPKEKWS